MLLTLVGGRIWRERCERSPRPHVQEGRDALDHLADRGRGDDAAGRVGAVLAPLRLVHEDEDEVAPGARAAVRWERRREGRDLPGLRIVADRRIVLVPGAGLAADVEARH